MKVSSIVAEVRTGYVTNTRQKQSFRSPRSYSVVPQNVNNQMNFSASPGSALFELATLIVVKIIS